MLQHYLSLIDELFVSHCLTDGASSTRIIRSFSSQPRTSQILSNCSKFTRSTSSWYNSLMVLGLIPVFRARSACVHFFSPSRVDSKILIIHRSFSYNISLFVITGEFCYFISNFVIKNLALKKEPPGLLLEALLNYRYFLYVVRLSF